MIFDVHMARRYEEWLETPQGRAAERSLEWLIPTLLALRPGERVLEIGCGTGRHLRLLNRFEVDVNGVDASPAMVQRAARRLGRRWSVQQGSAEDLPYDDNEFDHAVLIHTLDFVEDPLQALMEAARVASRRVFAGVFNSLSWHGLVKKGAGCLGDPLFGSAHFFHQWRLRELFHQAFGPVPTAWGCSGKTQQPVWVDSEGVMRMWRGHRVLSGALIAGAAKMIPRVQTKNLVLTVPVKEPAAPLVRARQCHNSGAKTRSGSR